MAAEMSEPCPASLMVEVVPAGGFAGKALRHEVSATSACWHLEFFWVNLVAREELFRNRHEGEELPVLVPAKKEGSTLGIKVLVWGGEAYSLVPVMASGGRAWSLD